MIWQKNDNSSFTAKVALRAAYCPPAARVVECFAGYGKVWDEVSRHVEVVERARFDVQRRPSAVKLSALRALKSIDLSLFDVIDLDAYGMPIDELELVGKRGWGGVLFVTIGAGSRMMMSKARYLELLGAPRHFREGMPVSLFCGLGEMAPGLLAKWFPWQAWIIAGDMRYGVLSRIERKENEKYCY